MKSIKVNADYESMLFYGKGGSPVLNQTLEFLAFFIDDRPVFTKKKYSSSYFNYIESLTGRYPKTVSSGHFSNWWGPLVDLENERKQNSKITSTELVIRENWCSSTHVIHEASDFGRLDRKIIYLLKNPYGMSGQKFQLLRPEDHPPLEGCWIAEPLLNRKFDFSHYVYPDGRVVCYQNIVDKKFQYRGTILNQELSFRKKIEEDEWIKFQAALKIIIDFYFENDMPYGFSIDSFVYEEEGKYKIRFLSEVNYRRTMGSVALDFSHKFGNGHKWSLLLLGKSLLGTLRNKNFIIISPGDSQYDMIFFSSDSREEIQGLLSDGQFPVEI